MRIRIVVEAHAVHHKAPTNDVDRHAASLPAALTWINPFRSLFPMLEARPDRRPARGGP